MRTGAGESTVPALSSIRTGDYRRGEIAAAMLDDLLLGRPVHEEVVRERIEHVKRLLETSAAPIADIAAAAGFPAEAHLFALFRKTAGMTMRDWRRTHRDGPHPR